MVAGMIVAASAVALPAAEATATFSAPSPSVVTESNDYASEKFADPWDYSNGSDQRNAPSFTKFMSGFTMSGGVMSFTTTDSNAAFDPVWTIAGAFNHSRDGSLQPIDPARYTRMSIRMYVSSAPAGTSGVVSWFSCPQRTSSCEGARSFAVAPGWRVYDIPMARNLGAVNWTAGTLMRALRIRPVARANVAVRIDWLRLYRPRNGQVASKVTHDIPGGAAVYWDRDNIAANNTGNAAFGLLGTYANGATVPFPTDRYPPGTYYLYANDRGTARYSSAFRIWPVPQPVIYEPSLSGGADVAAAVRNGDIWDFSQRGDFGTPANVSPYSVSGGFLHGTNTNGDPRVPLTLPRVFNGTTWHRLTFRMSYDGPFGLGFSPGGGCLVRLVWRTTASSTQWNQTNDIVVFPGLNTVTVDLHSALMKEVPPGTTWYGWGGRTIDRVRFDPSEDPGPRRWHIDLVQVRADDAGVGKYTFTYADKAVQPGTTAKFYLDRDRVPGGTQYYLGQRAVAAGVNNWAWAMPGTIPVGTYWLRMETTDARRNGALVYSAGPVRLTR